MSISGLDSPLVEQAFEAARTERDGWLLLHYTSRDSLDLHAHGVGGAHQLKDTVLAYNDKSPLYGFTNFSGWKSVLSYTPNGTSRLLQARTIVHFQTILEHFSPHDVIVKATTVDDLGQTDAPAPGALPTETSSLMTARAQIPPTPISRPHDPGSPATPVLSSVVDDRPPSSVAVPGMFNLGEQRPESTNPAVSDILARLARRRSDAPEDGLALSDGLRANLRDGGSAHGESQEVATFDISKLLPEPDRTLNLPEEPRSKLNGSNGISGPSSSQAPREQSYANSTGRPVTSGSTRTIGAKKPKIRFFARPVVEEEVSSHEDRSKLPAAVRLRRDAEAIKPAVDITVFPSKFPHEAQLPPILPSDAGSLTAHNRSRSTSPTKPFAADAAASDRPERVSNHIVNQTRSQVSLSRPKTADTVVPNDRIGTASTTTAPTPAVDALAVEAIEASVKKPVPMTQERLRLLKAMQMRKRQQEEAAAAVAAANAPAISASVTAAGADAGAMDGNSAAESRAVDELRKNTIDGQAQALRIDLVSNSPRHVAEDGKNESEKPALPKQPMPIQNGQYKPTSDPSAALIFPPTAISPSLAGTTVSNKASPTSAQTTAGKVEGSHIEVPLSGWGHLVDTSLAEAPFNSAVDTPLASPLSLDSQNGSYSDEIQEATLGEAQAISIPPTPLSPINASVAGSPLKPRPRQGENSNASLLKADSVHGVAQSGHNGKVTPVPILVNVSRPSSAKRTNVSSGISRRIAALEERSLRSVSPSQVLGSPSPSSLELPATFLGSPALHTRNVSAVSRPTSRASSRQGTIRGLYRPLDPIQDTTPRMSADIPSHVSVTAHIVRTERQSDLVKPPMARPVLHQSHVVVEQQDANAARQSVKRVERPPSNKEGRPDSRGSAFSQIVGAGRNSIDVGLKFMKRGGRSESKSPTLTDVTTTSAGSLERVDGDQPDKKQSRTSRFFKRVSGLTHSTKTSISSEKKLSLDSREIKTSYQHLRVSKYIVGDLNVQFPDTLFWKRRWVEVDGTGNLVLTASQSRDTRVAPKRYHLSSFEHPMIPLPDRQELPHSIVLEFVNGGSLQLASDDRVGQSHTFTRLNDAYNAWTA